MHSHIHKQGEKFLAGGFWEYRQPGGHKPGSEDRAQEGMVLQTVKALSLPKVSLEESSILADIMSQTS
jgi:hypothetical protein